MAVNGMALVGEGGPEIVFLPPGMRVITPVVTVGCTSDVGVSIQFGPSPSPDAGDFLFDDYSGSLSVWNGTAWDEIRPFGGLQIPAQDRIEPLPVEMQSGASPVHVPCPYCGTLNLPGAAECGAGCWNGCGAALGVQ